MALPHSEQSWSLDDFVLLASKSRYDQASPAFSLAGIVQQNIVFAKFSSTIDR